MIYCTEKNLREWSEPHPGEAMAIESAVGEFIHTVSRNTCSHERLRSLFKTVIVYVATKFTSNERRLDMLVMRDV